MDKVVECQESNHEKEGSMQIAAAYKARAKVVDKEVEKDDNEGEEDDEDIEEMCELPRRITDQVLKLISQNFK
jgi:glutamyl-tRNA reductase